MNEYVKSNYYKIHDFEVIYLSLFQILAYKGFIDLCWGYHC